MTPWRIACHELRLISRHSGDAWLTVAFFMLVAVLFPFSVGADAKLLQLIGGGVIWIAALLAVLLSLPSLFMADNEDGTLEQWAIAPVTMEFVVAGKLLAHWIATGLPIIVLSPLLALLYAIPAGNWLLIMLSLTIGTPLLTCIGALGSALTVGLNRGGTVLAIIVLPLSIPVLIFGGSIAAQYQPEQGTKTGLLLLTAMTVFSIPACCFACASALKNACR